MHRTVRVPEGGRWLTKFLAFVGPGYMVSVGYMDPGNWATDLAGGAQFGYTLLSVILISNVMAVILQALGEASNAQGAARGPALKKLNDALVDEGWVIPVAEQYAYIGYNAKKVTAPVFPGLDSYPLLSSIQAAG